MKTTMKNWAALGLGTALLGTSLAGCTGPEGGEAGEAGEQETVAGLSGAEQGEGLSHHGEGGEGEGGEGEGGEGEGGEGEGGEGGHAVATLPLPKRLAFMTGHLETGLALFRAGEPAMAAPHLLHPVSETHAAERKGLDTLGFQANLFEAVSKALEDGKTAADIAPQLAAAQANLDKVTAAAGGDPIDIIRYLMDTIVEEYTIALTDGTVTDIGEYQDAYGFAIVARARAADLDPENEGLMAELDTLVGLWPANAPIPPATPTPLGQMIAQTSKIGLLLPN